MSLSSWRHNNKGDPIPCWGTAEWLVVNQEQLLCGVQNLFARTFSNPWLFFCPIPGRLIVQQVLQELKHYHG